MNLASRRRLASLEITGILTGACSTPGVIDTEAECAESFNQMVSVSESLDAALAGQEATISFQAAHEWEGQIPVCSVAVASEAGCRILMLDIDGSPVAWVDSGPGSAGMRTEVDPPQ